MRIVTFTAHPHYAALNCAGTIYNHTKNGDEVYMVTLTAGELMTNRISKEELARMNMRDVKKAANILGVKEVRNLGFKDSDITNRDEIRMTINSTIREFRPDVVLTNWPKSTHSDFRETSQAIMDGCMFALISSGKWAEKYEPHWVGNLYGFEVPELTVDFKPTVFVDITENIDKKIEAAKCFKTHYEGVPGRTLEHWISANSTGPSRYWGLKAGVIYAEPFGHIKIHESHIKPVKLLT